MSEQPRQRPAPAAQIETIDHTGRKPDPEHADPVGAVQHRNPQHALTRGARPAEDLTDLISATREGPLHLHGFPPMRPDRNENPLRQVDHQHLGGQPQGPHGLVDHARQLITGHQVRIVDDLSKHVRPKRSRCAHRTNRTGSPPPRGLGS